MPRFFLLSIFTLAAGLGFAQQPPPPAVAQQAPANAGSLPEDPVNLSAVIRASYYHPDSLGAIRCNLAVDWPTLLAQTKTTITSERLKDMQGLKVHTEAVRGMVPQVTFDWQGGTLDTKDQVEAGLHQVLSGFYQAYWPMFAATYIKNPNEFSRIEPLPDGSMNIYETDPSMRTVITVSKAGVPIRYTFDGTSAKGFVEPKYVDSPHPQPGDLRRLSSIVIQEQLPTSNFNIQIDTDYQLVDGFNIPKHVTFSIIGTYSIKMEFNNCSATPLSPAGPAQQQVR